jgi:hypothetical protein
MKFVVYERLDNLSKASGARHMHVFHLWSARVAWVLLPVTAGVVIADALEGWSSAPALVAMVLLWAAWFGGAVALLAPRPWGFALLRVVAPSVVLVTAWALTSDANGALRAVALIIAAVAAVLALSAPVARASANALAYGDEDRYPLVVPWTLALAPLPLAVAVVAAGIASGPLLLADGRIVAGVIALVVGFPLAALAANSVFALSRRWAVLVPAGLVVVDPLTLADPVLMPREQVLEMSEGVPCGALDLRLGPARNTFTVVLHEPAPFVRRRGRTDAVVVQSQALHAAAVDLATFLGEARRRRLPVSDAPAPRGQRAVPPPSTTSPS